nr:hypothetical protein [Tanacetum cinerariifolium]
PESTHKLAEVAERLVKEEVAVWGGGVGVHWIVRHASSLLDAQNVQHDEIIVGDYGLTTRRTSHTTSPPNKAISPNDQRRLAASATKPTSGGTSKNPKYPTVDTPAMAVPELAAA